MSRPHQIWPAEFADTYRRKGYWRGETIGDMLRATVERHPDHPALVYDEGRMAYGELDALVDRLAAAFVAMGFAPGERVLVQLPNVPEFVAVVFGLFRADLLPVFVLPAHRRAEIEHFGRTAGAVGYVTIDTFAGFDYVSLAREVAPAIPSLRQVVIVGNAGEFTPYADLAAHPSSATLPRVDPSSVAFLQLSGGSTGFSKLIPRTHDDYLYSVRESAVICGLDDTSVFMATLPIGHNFTMSSPGILGAIYAGSTVALTRSPVPDVAFPAIERHRVTITGLVPPLALIWERAARTTSFDLSSLRVLQVGGAKLTPAVARRIRETFPSTILQQVFGMAEGLVNYTRLDDPDDVVINTQGRPISDDDEVLVVDDKDRPVPDGHAGHLLTRGPYTIRAYYEAPETNSRAFTAEGFYRTGDVVSRDSRGYLTVLGRATDMINRGGEKVSAEEIEDHLVAHPQVHDAVVVALPDPYLGERTCAAIVPRGEVPRPAAIKAWIRSRGLAAYKVPDQVVVVDAFPETAVGKTSRKEIRAALRAQLASAQAKAEVR
jgi:2,3-dihydroxybenzoate-AMP ligase